MYGSVIIPLLLNLIFLSVVFMLFMVKVIIMIIFQGIKIMALIGHNAHLNGSETQTTHVSINKRHPCAQNNFKQEVSSLM